MPTRLSRRRFVQSAALATAGLLTGSSSVSARPVQQRRPLLDRFSDLRRHFVFEYYPWYRTDPWEHWPEAGSQPPETIGSNYMPALGAYDSRSTAVMERHARWIAESGAGAIDVSWWGPDSNVNEVIPTLMDVMAAHDIHVTFYIEPYADDHAQHYARDVMYRSGTTASGGAGTVFCCSSGPTARQARYSSRSARSCCRRAPTATGRPARSATMRQTMCGGGRPIRSGICCATTSID
jgi:hypothetical protein